MRIRESTEREQVLMFGPFQLYPDRKMLLENGRVVRLGSRAMDLLVALVERAGELVGKNELMSYAWPDTIVEENNLRVHITSLRKCLGDGQAEARYIVNVAGRGYCFVATVSREVEQVPQQAAGAESCGNLPVQISRPLGRSRAITALTKLVSSQRLVTIVGEGGIGKSTLALAVADRLNEVFQQKIYFVDASTIVGTVAAAIGSAIGASLRTDDPCTSLIDNLRDTRMLLLLDNCEHMIAQVAELAVRLLRYTHVTVLATSREPLLADGEQIYRLASLDIPPPTQGLSAKAARSYASVQLFVERAMNSSDSFELTDSNAGSIATICRKLDGVPLAIEIVAARAALVGIEALELGFDDAHLLGVPGRRTASLRHRSMRATLDWSYQYLSPVERAVLQRLSVFRDRFSAASAIAVAKSDGVNEGQVLEAIMSLAAKSLLGTDVSGNEFNYRLLHLTRVYAADLLQESGKAHDARRRHAQHWCRFLDAAVRDYVSLTRVRWLSVHQSSIDDVRAALEWAFAPGGDERLGVQLTEAAVTFGFQFELIDEFKQRISLAISVVQRFAEPAPDLEARLGIALNVLNNRTAESSETSDIATVNMERVIALARASDVPQNLIWPLTTRALIPLDYGDYANAVDRLTELDAAAKGIDDAFASLTADRVGAMVLHWAGLHSRARTLAERVLRHPAAAIPLVYSGTSVDRQVSMRVVISRILWLEGAADQARDLAAEAVQLAAADNPNAICDALGHAACPIAFWRGDIEAARKYTNELLECSRRYTLTRWYIAALCFQKVLTMNENAGSGADIVVNGSSEATPLPGLQCDLMATISHQWVDAITLERGRHQLGGWCSPELLRVAGEQKLLEVSGDVDRAAEVIFLQALECAREQRALAWELRVATSLARVWMRQERRDEAEKMLRSVYDRFTEGHDTADLLQARAVLTSLRG